MIVMMCHAPCVCCGIQLCALHVTRLMLAVLGIQRIH